MDIATILTKRYPEALWSLDGDNYSGLNWISGGQETHEEIP